MVAFFIMEEELVNIYVYSDESGVFDKEHNDYFVFGGLILIGNKEKEKWSRMYSHAENIIRNNKGVNRHYELKATRVTNKEKGSLFRSLNNCYKFGVVVQQQKVLDRIFNSKKDKQRYLDYAYKIAVKRAFERLISDNKLIPENIDRIFFCVDEHTTATNGRYELKEALEQEFKWGTYNFEYSKFYPPIFSNMRDVQLDYCNSSSKLLIRAADIVANRIYFLAKSNKYLELKNIRNANIIYLP
ncbi:MAG: DUF3800 domain-containing protein [Intestinibacter bartlettii]